jgi:hypothetical protein
MEPTVNKDLLKLFDAYSKHLGVLQVEAAASLVLAHVLVSGLNATRADLGNLFMLSLPHNKAPKIDGAEIDKNIERLNQHD